MTMKVALNGLARFKRGLSDLSQLSGLDAELDIAAKTIATTAAENLMQITTPTTSGKLTDTLRVSPGEQEFSRRIGSGMKRAVFLEFGTLHTPSQPWLSAALAAEKLTIVKRLSDWLLLKARRRSVTGTHELKREE